MRIGSILLASITAIGLCLPSAVAMSTEARSADGLSTVNVTTADNGDLMGWQVDGLGRGTSELIEPPRALLLEVSVGDRRVDADITWRRSPPEAAYLDEFVGTLANPAIEVQRRYVASSTPGAIVHEVQFLARHGELPANLSATVRIPPSLATHAASDGSLGAVIYGYRRLFRSDQGDTFSLVDGQARAGVAVLATRHIALIAKPMTLDGAALELDPTEGISLLLDGDLAGKRHRLLIEAVALSGTAQSQKSYRGILYGTLWSPIRSVAHLIEAAIETLTKLVGNAGLAVIMFALLVRAILLPVALWSIRQQRRFTATQAMMKPKIDHIKNTVQGAARSEQILQVYKDCDFAPFSGLKGSLALFIQLPILIAFFTVTTETAHFRDAPFLWIQDLSLPDRAFALPFSIPGFGSYLNLLPLALGAVSGIAALFESRSNGTGLPRSGLLLALVFVGFFYSCAAALVLYWLTINVSQVLEGLYVTRTSSSGGDSSAIAS